jgi:hypothetical protein
MPTVVLTNQYALNVPTSSTLDSVGVNTFSAYRAASATGTTNFIDSVTASAEL